MTIKCDVELPVKLEDLAHAPADKAKLAALFERFEFKTWRRELEENSGSQSALDGQPEAGAAGIVVLQPAPERHYETIFTEQQLDSWLAKISGAQLVSVDTETTSLDPFQARLVGISFSVEPGYAAYLPLAHNYAGAPPQLALGAALAKLKPWLEDGRAAKLGQNLKYDAHVFANHGIRLDGIAHDTLLQSYVLESHKPHDLDSLAARHLGVQTVTYFEVCGKGVGQICFDQVPIERATDYASEDADVALQLHRKLHPQIESDAKLTEIYRDIEMPVMTVLQTMERQGVLLDSKLLSAKPRARDQDDAARGRCAPTGGAAV